MNEIPIRAKSIALVNFQEEPLPSGRKLLHCIFKDKFSDNFYKWTAPWKEKGREHGVEGLFFKALEVEEWNDPDGVWDEELKKAADAIPPLGEWKLPVRVECSGLTAVAEPGYEYELEVSVLSDEKRVTSDGGSIRIGNCVIGYERFRQEFVGKQYGEQRPLAIGVRCTSIKVEESYGFWKEVGVKFVVGLPEGLERQDYRVVGRKVGSFVRSYIRRTLADYDILKKAFDG